VTSLNLTHCIRPKQCSAQCSPTAAKVQIQTSQTVLHAIVFLNCALHNIEITTTYGFQANIFTVITIIKTTVLLDHFYSSYLFFFWSFPKKENNFSRNKSWEAEQKAAIRALSKPQQSGNNYSHSVGGSRKTIWGKDHSVFSTCEIKGND